MALSGLILGCLVSAAVATASIGGNHFPVERPRPDQRRCTYSKAYGMRGADCFNLNLPEIPTYLKSNIEILEATFNRIRELRCDSLSRYTSLKLLYLGDNLISHIEEGAFEDLTSLEVVDISLNAIHTVPLDLLSLPNLRKLYLNNNRIQEFSAFEKAPRSFSLVYLSLVGCHLKELPALGSFPRLVELNVSNNDLQMISVTQVASLCSLQWVGLMDNRHLFRMLDPENCSCVELSEWFARNGIRSAKLNCTTDLNACSNITSPPDALQAHSECLSDIIFQEEFKQVQKTWIVTAVSLLLSVAVLMLLLYWVHRRNVLRRKQLPQNAGMKFDKSSLSSLQLIETSLK